MKRRKLVWMRFVWWAFVFVISAYFAGNSANTHDWVWLGVGILALIGSGIGARETWTELEGK